jgi:hypothetical protein
LKLLALIFLMLKLPLVVKKWVNVEIHLKSSDWYVHNHELDDATGDFTLVWEHDTDIF